MKGAPNPWRGSGQDLEFPSISGREILDGLREIIGNWPGEKTAVIDAKDRHLRFILAVAGYPELESSTRPFDMPLSKRSSHALRISRMLDSIVGMHANTSLRSSILNNDLNLRLSGKSDDLESIIRSQNECLSLLFARLRQLDEPEPEPESELESEPKFRMEEEALLATLHSYDNTRRGDWWPNLKDFNDGRFSHIFGAEDPGPMPFKFRPDFTEEEKKTFDNWKEKSTLWKRESRKEYRDISDSFSYSVADTTPMTFQFHFVQTWLRKKAPLSSDGQSQRFLRGASILLELAVAECRHRIAEDIGIGSITADGGGRVSFLCPVNREGEFRGKLENSVSQFLLNLGTREGDLEGSVARNNLRFSTTIDRWGDCCFLLGEDDEEKSESEKWGRKDAKRWFTEVSSSLPPFSVTTYDPTKEVPMDILERLRSQHESGYPKIRIHGEEASGETNDCSFCPGGPKINKDSSLSHRMGVSRIVEEELRKEVICTFHRLMFHLGHDQRLRDSTLRVPTSENPDYQCKDSGRDRKVTSIARIDGNSLGILFNDRYLDEFEEGPQHDRRRRRSFRFNSYWWSTLQEAVDGPGAGDRIAAWVIAGDDVVLAEYGLVDDDATEEGENLREAIHGWATKLSEIVELDRHMSLSFGAGISKDRGSGGIMTLLENAGSSEVNSKRRWKSMMDNLPLGKTEAAPRIHPMLTKHSNNGVSKVEWEPLQGWEDFVIYPSLSLLVQDDQSVRNEEEDSEYRVDDFVEWNEEVIDRILAENNMSNLDEEEKWRLISRHFFEIHEDGKKNLVILMPNRQEEGK